MIRHEELKVERISQLPFLKKQIISYLFEYVSKKPRDDQRWYKYNGNFFFDNEEYDLECECKRDADYFTYRNMHIQHKTKIIEVESLFKGD